MIALAAPGKRATMASITRLKNVYVNNGMVFYCLPAGKPVGLSAADGICQLQQVENYSREWEYGSIICSELEKGSAGYVISVNGAVAHYSFVTFESLYVAEVRRQILLPPDSMAIYNCYTGARFRRRGLFVLALQSICALNTMKHKYVYALEHNLPSRSAIDKAGFKEIGRMRFWRLGLFESFLNGTAIDVADW